MLLNDFYNSASQVFYALKQQGYSLTTIDTVGCNHSAIKETWLLIDTPRKTRILVRHAQFFSAHDGGFVDMFDVRGVSLPSGEYCKGEKFRNERWDMLQKAAIKARKAH